MRPDNMGDLLMSGPAIGALRESLGCAITVLTSPMAKGIARHIPGIDEVMVWEVPWVKGTSFTAIEKFNEVVNTIKEKHFDGAVIFTVFSQNPMPAALLVTLAGIPNRIAYCRENPYHLLSHWIPEEEPYSFIRHQVRRDLELVKHIGAYASDEKIRIQIPEVHNEEAIEIMRRSGVNPERPWLIIHPGVSEEKRRYPQDLWAEAGRRLVSELGYQIMLTGSALERPLAQAIAGQIGAGAFNLAGSLSLEAFVGLIRLSPLLISVNTGSIHLAAAVQTKVIVLYALTNPQHTPWKTKGKVLPFSIAEDLQSRNAVLRYVRKKYYGDTTLRVHPGDIVQAAYDILIRQHVEDIALPEAGTFREEPAL